jgi:hypothetical protein
MSLTTPIISSPTVSGTISTSGGYTQTGTSQNYFTGITNMNVNNATILSLTNSGGIAGITFNSSGGSKNLQLNSFGSFQVDTSILPSATLTYNLGDSLARWNNLFSNNANFSGTITTGLTASRLVQTNGSSQMIASNALPSGCTATNMTLTTPKIITSIDANSANNDDIGITTPFRNTYLRQLLQFNRVNNATPCIISLDVGNVRGRIWSRFNGDTGASGDWLYTTYNYFVNSSGTFTVDNAMHKCSRLIQSADEFRFGWSSSNATVPTDRLIIDYNNALYPATNAGLTLGRSSFRWSTILGTTMIDLLNTMNGYVNNTSDTMQIITNITPGTNTLVNSARSGSRINLWQGDASNVSDFSIDLSTSVGGSASRALTIRHNIILPNTNNYIDLGSSSNRMKTLFTTDLNSSGSCSVNTLSSSGFCYLNNVLPTANNTGSIGSSTRFYDTSYSRVSYYTNVNHSIEGNYVSPNAGTGFAFGVGGTYCCFITSNGFLQISGNTAYKSSGASWTNPSDERLKTNIEDFTDGGEILKNIRPRKFEYKNNLGKKCVGVIAQEIINHYPECISKDNSDYYQYDSSDLLYIAINSIKELMAKNEKLTQRIATLENLINQ